MVWESLSAIFMVKNIYIKKSFESNRLLYLCKKDLLLKYIVVCVHFNTNTQRAQF